MKPQPVRERRLAQGEAAILSASTAAKLLPFRNGLRWLKERGIVRYVLAPGAEEHTAVVVWGDVLSEIRGDRRPVPTPPKRGAAHGTVPWLDPSE